MKRYILPALALICLLFVPVAQAKHIHPEAWYQDYWCERNNGVAEYVLPSGMRVDCLTETHAVEHDFAAKYREGIVQGLEYAMETGKRAAVVLIIEKPSDRRFIKRAVEFVDFYRLPIDVWEIER